MRRLTQIDDLIRALHPDLGVDDECFFLREYTVGKSFDYSETNSLINNLKKPLSLSSTAQWPHKQKAIQQCGAELKAALGLTWLRRATLVPMPPSKHNDDPEYDDRILKVIYELGKGEQLDVRELLLQRQSMPASHRETRASVQELIGNYRIHESSTDPAPAVIGLFDDVLTRGTHFRAAKRVLTDQFGPIRVIGIFIARSVYAPNVEGGGDAI